MRMVEQVSFGMQIPFEDPYFQIGQVQQGFKRLRLIEVKVVGSEQSPRTPRWDASSKVCKRDAIPSRVMKATAMSN
jgi:hypothetical protein